MTMPRALPRTMPAPERSARVRVLRERLLERPEILVACLHGSFHEGLAFRDVDVAVWLDADNGLDVDNGYAMELAVSLSRAVGLTIDVQILNAAPLAFRYHALRGEPLVVRDEAFLADLRAATWARYFDFQPFARAYWRETLGG
jgi:uncharacterized protein